MDFSQIKPVGALSNTIYQFGDAGQGPNWRNWAQRANLGSIAHHQFIVDGDWCNRVDPVKYLDEIPAEISMFRTAM
jgi:hypothetical protein